jgi:hypothetical protein
MNWHFLYAGNFSASHNTEALIADALESLGCRVDRLQENEWSSETLIERLAAGAETSPSPAGQSSEKSPKAARVLLFAKLRLSDTPFGDNCQRVAAMLQTIRARKWVDATACWIFDLLCPEFSPTRFIWTQQVAAGCDAFFTTDGYTVGQYEVPNAIVLRQGSPVADLGRRGKAKPEFECDVAHLGSVYLDRRGWAKKMRLAFGSRFKSFEDIRGDDLYDLCASAKVIAGPGYPLFDEYWSNRIYVATGYGGCFAAPVVEGMTREGWQPGEHFLSLPYETDDAIEALRWMIRQPEEWRRKIAEAGQRFVIENFTYRHRAAAMLAHLEQRLTGNQPAKAAS